MEVFIVTAYRWGDRENHSYVVGAFSTKDEAILWAKKEEEWRGGKYDCEVIVMQLNYPLKYKNYEVVYNKEIQNEKSSSKGLENTEI
jgi:hypothetical protein